MFKRRYLPYFPLVFSLITLTWLWFINLSNPIWVDEAVQISISRSVHEHGLPIKNFDMNFFPWQEKNGLWDPAKPLSFYLFAPFFYISDPIIAGRTASLFFSVLSVILIFLIVKEFYKEIPIEFVLFFTVFSTLFLSYMITAKPFLVVQTFSLLTFYTVLKFQKTKNPIYFDFSILFFLLGVLSHFFFILLSPIILFFVYRNKNSLKSSLRSMLNFVLLLSISILWLVYKETLPFFHNLENLSPLKRVETIPSNLFYFVLSLISYLSGEKIPFHLDVIIEKMYGISIISIFFLIGLVLIIKNWKKDLWLFSWFTVPLILVSTIPPTPPKNPIYPEPRFFLYISLFTIFIITAKGFVRTVETLNIKRFSRIILIFTLLIPIITTAGIQFPLKNITNPFLYNDEYPQNIFYHSRFISELPDGIPVVASEDVSLILLSGKRVHSLFNGLTEEEITSLEKGHFYFINNFPVSYAYFCTDKTGKNIISCEEKYREFLEYITKNCTYMGERIYKC